MTPDLQELIRRADEFNVTKEDLVMPDPYSLVHDLRAALVEADQLLATRTRKVAELGDEELRRIAHTVRVELIKSHGLPSVESFFRGRLAFPFVKQVFLTMRTALELRGY